MAVMAVETGPGDRACLPILRRRLRFCAWSSEHQSVILTLKFPPTPFRRNFPLGTWKLGLKEAH